MAKLIFYLRKNILAKGDVMNFGRMVRYMRSVGDTSTPMYFVNGETVEIGDENADLKDMFIPFTDDYASVFKDAIFLVVMNHAFFFAEELSRLKSDSLIGAKVCFITMHPENCIWFINQLRKPQTELPEFFKIIKSKNALAFMDEANRIAAKLISGIEFPKQYLPTSYDKTITDVSIKPCTDNIKIGWFGRIDNEKIASVVNMLDNIYDYCEENNTKMTVYVIGDGNGRPRINVNSYSPMLTINFTSYLFGEQLKAFILENVDAIVAMGISAIDAAILGVPTVIPIVSDNRFVADRFVYLKDTEGYSLAWTQDVLRNMDMPIVTMADIIDDLKNGKKAEIGTECRKIVTDNFNVAHCTELFKESTSHTTLYVKEFLKLPLIKRTLRNFRLYRFITHREDINMFFLFFNRYKNVFNKHGLERIKAIHAEFSITKANKKLNEKDNNNG